MAYLIQIGFVKMLLNIIPVSLVQDCQKLKTQDGSQIKIYIDETEISKVDRKFTIYIYSQTKKVRNMKLKLNIILPS